MATPRFKPGDRLRIKLSGFLKNSPYYTVDHIGCARYDSILVADYDRWATAKNESGGVYVGESITSYNYGTNCGVRIEGSGIAFPEEAFEPWDDRPECPILF